MIGQMLFYLAETPIGIKRQLLDHALNPDKPDLKILQVLFQIARDILIVQLLGYDRELDRLPSVVQVIELVQDVLLQMRMVLDEMTGILVEQFATWRSLQDLLVKYLVRVLFTVAGHLLA